jgi:5-bromo-4-chloroindolyl phosphate hydrolysis protein
MNFSHPDDVCNLKDSFLEEYCSVKRLYNDVEDLTKDFKKAYSKPGENKPDYKPIFEKMDETQRKIENIGKELDPNTNPQLAKELNKISLKLSNQTRQIGQLYLEEPKTR